MLFRTLRGETRIKIAGDLFPVHILADKYNLLHPVSVMRIPFLHYRRVLPHHFHKFLFRCSGIPLSCLAELDLLPGLLENAGHVRVFGKVAQTLCTNHILRQLFGDEPVELVDIEGRTAEIHECADTVFLGLPLIVMMVVMMFIVPVMMSVLFMLFMLFVIFVIIIVMVPALSVPVIVAVIVPVVALFLIPRNRSLQSLSLIHISEPTRLA